MALPKYKTVTRTQGNNRALKEGVVKPEGFEFDFEEIPVLVQGFRRMVRQLEFDISEMALTTYVCARAHGVKFTALPVFLVRDFHHGAIIHNIKSPVTNPRQLEGKRVGVNRGYTVTTGVWARSILQDEYGVDLSKVTWVRSGDEHVASYQPPSNVVEIGAGATLEELLVGGELDAAIGIDASHPDLAPMITEPFEAAVTAMKTRGLYPINHLMVIKDETLAKNPDLGRQVFAAFSASKKIYVEKLKRGKIEELSKVD